MIQEKKSGGLKLSRYFTAKQTSPIDLFQYEKRTSIIRNPKGDAVFEMHDVEVPIGWSQVS